jgi:DNA invertase Pin-like site-specific DNA recombinase
MVKKVGLYCRVSTGNQSTGLEAQVRALRDYCTRNSINDYIIYSDENQSGVKQSRPALDRMMKDAREGFLDKVIVYSFSRYARSVTHLLRALEEFKKLEVGFVSITESIDTNTPLGSAVFTILGAVAQLERDLIAERVRNGLANAKAKGVHIGRVKMRDSDLIRKLRASGMTFRDVARIAKCSTGAVAAEMRAMKAEVVVLAKNIAEGAVLLPELNLEKTNRGFMDSLDNSFHWKFFDFDNSGSGIELVH